MANPHASSLRPTQRSASAYNPLWVESEAEFQALKPEWNALADAAPRQHVFLRHEWFDAAWAWRKSDARRAILCIRKHDQLVGIAPLIVEPTRLARLPLRRLALLTVPDTQFADILLAPDHKAPAASAIAAAIAAWPGWDALALTHLPENAEAMRSLLPAIRDAGIAATRQPFGENPLIDLNGEWEAFYSTRGRRLKKSNNLTANRIKKVGKPEIEWLHGRADPAVLQAWQADLIRVSAASWKETTGLTLDNPGPQAFATRLLAHAAERGWLSLWRLTLDGVTIATEFQLDHDGNIFALRADYDQAQRELSAGSYLNWKLLEQMFASELKRYYLGPGGNAYKARWTETGEPLEQLVAFNRGWRGRLAQLIEESLRPLARRLRARWRTEQQQEQQ